ncbi:pyroglutamyl-peptidase I [Acinetobacter seifertii]|uniref:pyroglutamyl-peptidase I n=1 Tax=Acinetobacter seifertii TaxID=1530123 RepID=UPI001C0D67D5|nr:pyroglutamyl-peptidase I [Acinetobacter seifertii]MBU3085427.1 pyroglutamyl-peptidase I [Acinetobacter seifertii]
MNILVTGFEPFQHDQINPSWEISKALDKLKIDGYQIHSVCLPVVFGKSAQILQQAIYHLKPDYVLCLGVAANRSAISLERIAINIDDAQIADNAGNQPIDQIIDTQGSPAFFSTLPIKAIFQKLRQENISVEISNSAGTYVCNHVFYHLMSIIKNTQIKGGFIHVPASPEMVTSNCDTIDMDIQIQAIYIAIKTMIKNEKDIKIIAGKIS